MNTEPIEFIAPLNELGDVKAGYVNADKWREYEPETLLVVTVDEHEAKLRHRLPSHNMLWFKEESRWALVTSDGTLAGERIYPAVRFCPAS